MSLEKILAEYASAAKEHPNPLGEILRAWAFIGEGYGCYSTFEIRPEFVNMEATPREFRFLWGRDPEDGERVFDGYDDSEELKRIQWFRHENGIEMGWHWDGDGTLAFYVPELVSDGCSGAIVNHDCKKDYEWEWTD